MLPLAKIREDLREIRYYYSRKENFDEAFRLNPNCSDILDRIRKYDEVMRHAPLKLNDIYYNLYKKNLTQEAFSAELNYVPEYIQRLNKKLLLFLQSSLNE